MPRKQATASHNENKRTSKSPSPERFLDSSKKIWKAPGIAGLHILNPL